MLNFIFKAVSLILSRYLLIEIQILAHSLNSKPYYKVFDEVDLFTSENISHTKHIMIIIFLENYYNLNTQRNIRVSDCKSLLLCTRMY